MGGKTFWHGKEPDKPPKRADKTSKQKTGQQRVYFKKCVIAAIGQRFRQYTVQQMRTWVESGGGTWRDTISDDVTHLICSRQTWNGQGREIQLAIELGISRVVTFDWLEDSTQSRNACDSRRYMHARIAKKAEKKAKTTKKDGKRGRKRKHDKEPTPSEWEENQDLRREAKRHRQGELQAIEDIRSSKQASTLTAADLRRMESQGQQADCEVTGAVPELEEEGEGKEGREGKEEVEEEEEVAEPEPVKKTEKTEKTGKTRKKRSRRSHIFGVPPARLDGILGTIETLTPNVPRFPTREERMKQRGMKHVAEDRELMFPVPDRHHMYKCPIINVHLNLDLCHIELRTNFIKTAFLRVYESDETPSTYAVVMRKSNQKPKNDGERSAADEKLPQSRLPDWASADAPEIIAPIGSTWPVAFEVFKQAFQNLTGHTWENKKDAGRKMKDDDPRMQGTETMAMIDGVFVTKIIKPFLFIWPRARTL